MINRYKNFTKLPLIFLSLFLVTSLIFAGCSTAPTPTPTATPTPTPAPEPMPPEETEPTPPPTSDTKSPVISNIVVSYITDISVRISWVSDEPATSQVEYGTTSSYGSTTTLDEELATSHSVSLSGLEPNTTYHFRAKSKDEAGNQALSNDYVLATSKPATEVSGIIPSNTIWTEESSPYKLTSTIQIPEGVTLTIEPGVTVTMPSSGDMFLLHGTISACGTANNKIIFDGGGNSVVITTEGGVGSAELDYCVIRNGYHLWDDGGHFNLTHCELINLTSGAGNPLHKRCVLLDNPTGDTYIEYNKFVNSGTVTVYQAAGRHCNVYIRYNLFQNMLSPIHHAGGMPGTCQLTVNYNSFIDTEGTILWLEQDFETASMNATENYWGTLDTNIIDQKIYDKNDDIRVKIIIEYLPILTEPHPSTPSPD